MTRDEPSITAVQAASISPAATVEPEAATPTVLAEKDAPVKVREQAYQPTEAAFLDLFGRLRAERVIP